MATKTLLIQIYNILKKYSSYDEPLTQQRIIDLLYDEYGVVCERKAVGRNISRLRDFYPLSERRRGVYLIQDEPALEEYEIRWLIDSVQGSKYIGTRYSSDLIDKLIALGGPDVGEHIKHVHSVNDWGKFENKDFFLNIDIIGEAIDGGKQIAFDYNTVGTDKKLLFKERYVGSPYGMLLNNQRYYVVFRNENKGGKISYLRIDRITRPEILPADAVPVTDNAGFEHGLNYHDLTTCLPYMFSDKPVRATLKCDKNFVKDLTDWFGDGFTVTKQEGDSITVRVRASEQAMIYWALQYNTNVEVLSPASLRNKIISKLKETLKMYQND